MAKLEWRWTVPSGEAVEARLERGIESVFLGSKETGSQPGLLGFAPNLDANAAMFSARRRLKREGAERPSVVAE